GAHVPRGIHSIDGRFLFGPYRLCFSVDDWADNLLKFVFHTLHVTGLDTLIPCAAGAENGVTWLRVNNLVATQVMHGHVPALIRKAADTFRRKNVQVDGQSIRV